MQSNKKSQLPTLRQQLEASQSFRAEGAEKSGTGTDLSSVACSVKLADVSQQAASMDGGEASSRLHGTWSPILGPRRALGSGGGSTAAAAADTPPLV